ncbi:MAG: lipid-A-disaccharide synthase [Flavobacteriales bacterium]|jgi:lipid-A-disaccharide synthase
MAKNQLKQLTRVAIVVGETSGDILGAGLIRELKKRHPNCVFEGIGGQRMIAEGFRSLVAMERLAVMGFVEPLKRLPELLKILKDLKLRYRNNKPDMFIGIDAPDFNLRLESSLKADDIYCVHYVSPSVWAWRSGRVKKIKKAVDLMLTLFPFETKIYQENKIDVAFVGHSLADDIPLVPNRDAALQRLGLSTETSYIALLPGSRKFEVENLLPTFIEAAKTLETQQQFLIPSASASRYKQIKTLLLNEDPDRFRLIEGQSHDVMAGSSLVVMASGTTSLEAMLLKKPMLICYKLSPLSYWIYSKLVKVKYVGLPNLLAGKGLVPELLQNDFNVESVSKEMKALLKDDVKAQLYVEFNNIHLSIRKNASEEAARIVSERWNEWSRA